MRSVITAAEALHKLILGLTIKILYSKLKKLYYLILLYKFLSIQRFTFPVNLNMASSKKHPYLWREIAGIILIGFSIFVVCCLITYNSDDQSLFKGYSSFHRPAKIHNWGGIIGSSISSCLFQIFGITAFLIPVALLFIAKKILFPSPASFFLSAMRPVGQFFVSAWFCF